MIYTSSALTRKHNSCPRGPDWLEQHGLSADTPVSMGSIVRTLGVYDALFSFCEVFPECEGEARTVLRNYGLYIAGMACRFICLSEYNAVSVLAQSNAVLNQWARGTRNENHAAKMRKAIGKLPRPSEREQVGKWYMAYDYLLSNQHDYMKVMQATRALIEGADIADIRAPVYDEARRRLFEALGEEDGPPLTTDEVKVLGDAYTAGIAARRTDGSRRDEPTRLRFRERDKDVR